MHEKSKGFFEKKHFQEIVRIISIISYKNKDRRQGKKKTLRPSNLIGTVWPGTTQSGPAASTIASLPNPFPIGLDC